METESTAEKTEKIDRESPLNTNPQHTNCFLHQTHRISLHTRRTSPATARGRGGTEDKGGNLIVETKLL